MRQITPRRRWATALIATTTAVPLLFSGAATAWALNEPDALTETAPDIVAEVVEETAPVAPRPDEAAPAPHEVAPAPQEAAPAAAPAAANPQPTSTNDPQSPITLTIDVPELGGVTWYDAPITVTARATSRIGADTLVVWSTSGAQTGAGEAARAVTIPVSANGATTVTVSAVDSEGNGTEEYVHTIKIDTTTPRAILRFPVAEVYRVGDAMVADFVCESDVSPVETCTFRFGNTYYFDGETIPMDTVGSFDVVTVAINGAGTWGQSYRQMRVIEDEDDAPIVEIEAPPASGGWYSDPFYAVFRGNDDDGSGTVKVEYRETVDGVAGPWQYVDGPAATGYVAGDGTHTFEVRATDAFGNVSDIETISFPVDATAPAVTVGLPTEGITVAPGDELTLDFDCSDALSGLAQCTGTVEDGELLDTSELGTFTVTVRARDNAGNETVVERTYTVAEPDVEGPELIVGAAGGEASGWFFEAPDVTIDAADPSGVADIVWEIEGPDGSLEQGSSEVESLVLPARLFGEGVWTVRVTATDGAGNQTEDEFELRVDGAAPVVTIDAPANRVALVAALDEFEQGTTVAFDYTCTDAVSGIESCVSSVGGTLPTDRVGTFTAEVVALDAAGHRTVQALEYTVVAADPASNPGSTGGVPTLARTGSETGWQTALLALGLLAVGGAAAGSVVVVRRGR